MPQELEGFFRSFTVELWKAYSVINIGLFTDFHLSR